MKELTKDELLDMFDSLINEYGMWRKMKEKLEGYGYKAEDYDNVMENLDL